MWKVCRALFRAVMPNYKCDIKSFKSHIKGKKKNTDQGDFKPTGWKSLAHTCSVSNTPQEIKTLVALAARCFVDCSGSQSVP